MEKHQLAFFAGTVRKKSPDNSTATIKGAFASRKASAKPRKEDKKNRFQGLMVWLDTGQISDK